MLGNMAQEERQELIKYYIFESYSVFSQSTNLRFSARSHAVLYAMFDERFNRGSARHTVEDFYVIRDRFRIALYRAVILENKRFN